ncbi:hypothetical protein KO504_03115 [Winogradskyella psychrotolerans]|uniref:hypothetical protein n=1 Tax=Winogradskyella psychrotolerans TaxID=1344585 RepID=UPI001C0662A7|nr:hypothetical protein [Winogradskyella psychrotolerans]MBU2920317.1 hypothetical protein [Winogradskyella psychrotolerans]
MKKGNKHYIVFKRNNAVQIHENINKIDKSEVRFVIERTYRKQSSGGYYKYFTNTILDSDLKSTDSKLFYWDKVKCEIIKDEHWTAKRKDGSGAIILLKITDHFNNDKEYKFRTQKKNAFEIIKNKLISIEKFGLHENAAEFEKLNRKVNSLEAKINELEKILKSIQLLKT